MNHYDAIIIGAGQAGGPLARKLAMAGKKTALIERRWVGGTCVNDGCTPTKTLIASARMAYLADKSSTLGIKIKQYTVDMAAIKKRKNSIVLSFRNGNQQGIESTKNLDLIMGRAEFTGDKTILVKLNDGTKVELTADQIFINTGAKTIIPEIEGLTDIKYLTSTSILDLDAVPEHLLIIGGSYIALEFGQMYRRFGSKITIIEKSARIASREDEDISDELASLLKAEDITIFNNSTAIKFKKKGSGKINVTVDKNGVEEKITCTHVLVAVGRKASTSDLKLEKAGVQTDVKGNIKVNDQLETNIAGIYALGDVNGGPAFTHISYNDFTIVYRNLIENANLRISGRLVPYCMFTDPQLGRIGLSESEAKKRNLNYKVAKLPMSQVGRAIETADTRGFLKAIVDADTKLILGVAVLGAEGGELMTILQIAMMGGLTYEQIKYCVFAHPLYAESLNSLFMTLDTH